MPYIPQKERADLQPIVDAIEANTPQNAGQLQYVIARIIKAMAPKRYQAMNDVMGALTGAQAEFYRLIVAPYEDKKMNDNGSVYYVPGVAQSRQWDPNVYEISSKGYGEVERKIVGTRETDGSEY